MKRTATLVWLGTLALLLAACTADETERNKDIVRRMVAAVNERNLDALSDVVSADVHRYSGATPEVTVESLDQFEDFLRQGRSAVSDGHQEINFMLAENDLVAAHLTYRGTQKGQMGPFPPSNQPFEVPFIGILRIEDGKIAEMWVEWDNLNMLKQLGHFPPPAEAGSEVASEAE